MQAWSGCRSNDTHKNSRPGFIKLVSGTQHSCKDKTAKVFRISFERSSFFFVSRKFIVDAFLWQRRFITLTTSSRGVAHAVKTQKELNLHWANSPTVETTAANLHSNEVKLIYCDLLQGFMAPCACLRAYDACTRPNTWNHSTEYHHLYYYYFHYKLFYFPKIHRPPHSARIQMRGFIVCKYFSDYSPHSFNYL